MQHDEQKLSASEVNEAWTEMTQMLDKKYAGYRKNRRFLIKPSVEGEIAYVKMVLRNDDESFYYPVEARLNFIEEEMSSLEAQTFLIDYIDLYFEEFFLEDESLYLPIDWSNYEYDATKFQMRGQIFNRKLEGMADALLGIN